MDDVTQIRVGGQMVGLVGLKAALAEAADQCRGLPDDQVAKILLERLSKRNYIQDPPSVTFKAKGKLITVYSRRTVVNALKDETEARKIVEWLKRENNDVWQNPEGIVPSFKGAPRPPVIEILKRLPRTNCRVCGEPTCMVFAARLAEGAKGIAACPPLDGAHRQKLEGYMARFNLVD